MKNSFLLRAVTLFFCSGMILSLSAMNQQEDFEITVQNNLTKKVNIVYSRATSLGRIISTGLMPGNLINLKQPYYDKIGSLIIEVEGTKPFELPAEALIALSEEPLKIILDKASSKLGYRATIESQSKIDKQLGSTISNQLNYRSGNRVVRNSNSEMIEYFKELPQELKRHIISLTLASTLNDNFKIAKVLGTEQDPVLSGAFSPDGKTVLTGLEDGTACLLDTVTGNELILVGHLGSIHLVAFSPDGKTALTGSNDATVRLWDVKTGEQKLKIITCNNSVAFSPDGSTIVIVSIDGMVRSYDAATGKQNFESIIELREYRSVSVVFSPDSKTILVGWANGIARIIDVKTGECLNEFAEGDNCYITSGAFSPDGKTIAIGSMDNVVSLWDVAIGQRLYSFRTSTGCVYSVAFSPDGNKILAGSIDGTVTIFDSKAGESVKQLIGHKRPVGSVVFSSGGNAILTVSKDGIALLWKLSECSHDIFAKRKNAALENYKKYYPLLKTMNKAI